jgi:hypothetical protein
MATAVLAVVFVTGALTSCGQQSRQIGTLGGATPTTTASSSLPMTVSANGISVTLNMVDSTSSATRFYVDIALPAYAVDRPADFVLGQTPADDVQIDGLSASASDLKVSEVDTTSSSHALWLDYPSPFPTNGTVKLTFKQLWLPAKPTRAIPTPADYAKYTPVPVVMQTIEGPWVFHITPTILDSQPLPTPRSGIACFDVGLSTVPDIDCYGGLSATEAQKLVDFPVSEPAPLPASLTRDDFGVSAVRVGPTRANRPNSVSLNYPLKSGQQGVNLTESTNPAALPNIKDGTALIVTSLLPDAPAQPQPIRPGTLKTIAIAGVTVTRFELGGTDSPGPNFFWSQAGVNYHISLYYRSVVGTATPLITDADLIPMVTSIIEQGAARNPATPITSP